MANREAESTVQPAGPECCSIGSCLDTQWCRRRNRCYRFRRWPKLADPLGPKLVCRTGRVPRCWGWPDEYCWHLQLRPADPQACPRATLGFLLHCKVAMRLEPNWATLPAGGGG